jgi:hypothetical protein
MKISFRTFSTIAVFNCLDLVSGDNTKLDINPKNSEHPLEEKQKCQERKSFVWCLPINYNKEHEPWWDIDTTSSTFPWKYDFYFHIREIQWINDEKQKFKLSMHLELTWEEPRLSINETATEWTDDRFGTYGEVIATPRMFTYLWHPDLYISQLRKFKTRTALADLSGLHIRKNKTIMYEAFIDVTIGCLMIFDDYPFDSHFCPFEVGSYYHMKTTVTCTSSYDYDTTYQRNLQHYIEFLDLDKQNEDAFGIDKNNKTNEFARCGFVVSNRRSRIQIMFQVYLTSAMFVVVSWVSFVINPHMVPARIALLLTNFLVLVNIFNAVKSNAPVSKALNAIDEYLLTCITLVFMALFEYTIILCKIKNQKQTQPLNDKEIMKHGEEKRQTNFYSEAEENNKLTKNHLQCYNYGHLDKFSLIAFPVFFLVFNAVYWAVYI